MVTVPGHVGRDGAALPVAAIRRFDVVFVVGGHGPMQDLAVDPAISDLLNAVVDDPGQDSSSACRSRFTASLA